MKINTDLTMFRCKLNKINIETSTQSLDTQESKLVRVLGYTVEDFPFFKAQLDIAMQKGCAYRGFTDEIDMLISKNQYAKDVVRGHDYLKLWFKTFFMIVDKVTFIIADAATHHILQNILTYEQKQELIRMMRGFKRDLVEA